MTQRYLPIPIMLSEKSPSTHHVYAARAGHLALCSSVVFRFIERA